MYVYANQKLWIWPYDKNLYYQLAWKFISKTLYRIKMFFAFTENWLYNSQFSQGTDEILEWPPLTFFYFLKTDFYRFFIGNFRLKWRYSDFFECLWFNGRNQNLIIFCNIAEIDNITNICRALFCNGHK